MAITPLSNHNVQTMVQQPELPRAQPFTNVADHIFRAGESSFDAHSPPPVELSGGQPGAFVTGGAPVFAGFDAGKLGAPLKLCDDGRPKSAKYTFAQLAQAAGSMPKSKAESEQWFNANIRAGMEAAGFQVDAVKGDRAFIHTRENPQGEWVDFVQGAASGDPKLAWQPDGPDAAGAAPAALAHDNTGFDPFSTLVEAFRKAREEEEARARGGQT